MRVEQVSFGQPRMALKMAVICAAVRAVG